MRYKYKNSCFGAAKKTNYCRMRPTGTATISIVRSLAIAVFLCSPSSNTTSTCWALSFNSNQKNSFQSPWPFSFPKIFESTQSSSSSSLPEIQDQQIQLDNGISAQILSCLPKKKNQQSPPLIFLHGSFHAAWCWSEKFFPYFVEKGYPCVAFSWRGTGGTPAGEGIKKVKVSEHCDDLQCFLNELPGILQQSTNVKPVLLSHSFGGIVVMKYLEETTTTTTTTTKPSDLFSGIITMCSVPPSGNGKMTMRFLKRSWIQSWKITAGFAMKKSCTDPKLCRDLFFGGQPILREEEDGTTTTTVEDYGVTDDDIKRYQGYFTRDTAATIDLFDLAKKLPSTKVDDEGRAPFYNDLPPSLVIGAKDDFIVDKEGNIETANYYGLQDPLYVDSPHDVMLGSKWQNCADTIHGWIQDNVKK